MLAARLQLQPREGISNSSRDAVSNSDDVEEIIDDDENVGGRLSSKDIDAPQSTNDGDGVDAAPTGPRRSQRNVRAAHDTNARLSTTTHSQSFQTIQNFTPRAETFSPSSDLRLFIYK